MTEQPDAMGDPALTLRKPEEPAIVVLSERNGVWITGGVESTLLPWSGFFTAGSGEGVIAAIWDATGWQPAKKPLTARALACRAVTLIFHSTESWGYWHWRHLGPDTEAHLEKLDWLGTTQVPSAHEAIMRESSARGSTERRDLLEPYWFIYSSTQLEAVVDMRGTLFYDDIEVDLMRECEAGDPYIRHAVSTLLQRLDHRR